MFGLNSHPCISQFLSSFLSHPISSCVFSASSGPGLPLAGAPRHSCSSSAHLSSLRLPVGKYLSPYPFLPPRPLPPPPLPFGCRSAKMATAIWAVKPHARRLELRRRKIGQNGCAGTTQAPLHTLAETKTGSSRHGPTSSLHTHTHRFTDWRRLDLAKRRSPKIGEWPLSSGP